MVFAVFFGIYLIVIRRVSLVLETKEGRHGLNDFMHIGAKVG